MFGVNWGSSICDFGGDIVIAIGLLSAGVSVALFFLGWLRTLPVAREELERPGGLMWGSIWYWRRLYDRERPPPGAWMVRQFAPMSFVTFGVICAGVGLRAVC